MHTLGLLFVTPDRNYFLADRIFISSDENNFLADGIFVSPDVIVGAEGNISKEKRVFLWLFPRLFVTLQQINQ